MNILSSIFLQRLIKLEDIFINKLIDINLLKNTIGITINIHEHLCIFYICNNKMKFCDNNIILNYNWIKLFMICNDLYLQNKKYDIYLNKYDYNGPFIYVDNKMIYFNSDDSYEVVNINNIKFDKLKRYSNILSFGFMIYSSAKYNLKKINSPFYLQYYIYTYIDNIEKYKEFIIKNNIESHDLNKSIYEGTSLVIACQENRIEIVKLLLKYQNININKLSANGVSSLFIACWENYTEIVDILIKHPNIDVNTSFDGMTPLYIACKKNYIEIVDILIKHPNIDVNTSFDGMTPLYIANSKGYTEIVDILIKHSNIIV
jgi:ankyrin repeat protein